MRWDWERKHDEIDHVTGSTADRSHLLACSIVSGFCFRQNRSHFLLVWENLSKQRQHDCKSENFVLHEIFIWLTSAQFTFCCALLLLAGPLAQHSFCARSPTVSIYSTCTAKPKEKILWYGHNIMAVCQDCILPNTSVQRADGRSLQKMVWQNWFSRHSRGFALQKSDGSGKHEH